MNHFKIVSLLSKINISAQELDICKTALKGISHSSEMQHQFWNYCHIWKLAPWIYLQLTKNELFDLLHQDVKSLFENYYQKIKQENEVRNIQAATFLRAFHKRGIDVVILKGNLFAHTVYHDVGYKKMNDFDILVHPKDWPQIQEVYSELGFIPMGFGWSGEKQKPARYSHTGIPYMSRDFKCIIGTQWGLKSPTRGYHIDMEEAWKSTIPFDFMGIPCKQLSAEYNLLHLIAHLGIYKCGIRDLMDIYNMLAINAVEVHTFKYIVQKAKMVPKTIFTLQLCMEAVPRCLSQTWNILLKDPMKPSFLYRRLQAKTKMLHESSDLHLSYNDYFQDIEKSVIYFSIFPKFHQKLIIYLQFLRLIYFPKIDYAVQFIEKPHKAHLFNKLQARLRAPWFSFALVAEEIGWTMTVLLFLKLPIDLLISPIFYIIHKESYFDFLKRQGIDPKNIKKVVDNVQ